MDWLPAPLAETIKTVAYNDWRSTRQIYERHLADHVTQRAISNRLQRLRAMKAVVCRKIGRVKLWRRSGANGK